jgi:hypothetical protein
MILKKFALLILATMLACATFADAQQRAKSRKTSKSKQPAQVSAPGNQAQPSNSQKPESSSATSEEPKPAAQPAEPERITVEELKEKIAKQEPITIIDSRSQGSYDATTTKIKGAIRIPMDDVEARLKEIPKDKAIVVYCT